MGEDDDIYIFIYIYLFYLFLFSLSSSDVSCSEGGALLGERGKKVVEDEEWKYWSGGMNDVKEVRKEVDDE